MAVPVSPVIPGLEHKQILLSSDAPNVRGLPCLRFADVEGTVLTRWMLSWRERLALILRGDIWIAQQTYWQQFQPAAILAEQPDIRAEQLIPGGYADITDTGRPDS